DPSMMPVPYRGSSNAAVPGVSCLQSAGGVHDANHLDYSQILMLVAPWCMVAGPGQDPMVPMRTADVYQSRELAGLVTDDAQPLPSVRQPFDPMHMDAARATFWAEQARIYEGKRRRRLALLDPRPLTADTGAPWPESGQHDPFASLRQGRSSA